MKYMLVITVLIIAFLYFKTYLQIKLIWIESSITMSNEEMFYSNSIFKDKQDIIDNFNQEVDNRKYVLIDLGANKGLKLKI
jgi:hypothetical protein